MKTMQCKWCESGCIKAGKQKDGTQKFRCSVCLKYQQKKYRYNAYKPGVHDEFIRFRTLGVPLRKMAAFLSISLNTLKKWLLRALLLKSEDYFPCYAAYDIDEMMTYVKSKKQENATWICYGWHIQSGKPVSVHIGGRSKKAISPVVNKVLQCFPKRINTDKLCTYGSLIPTSIHKAGKRKANNIERQHLNLRKDIAALARSTICLAKKREMLEARVRWYFWGADDPYFFLRPG